MYNTSLSLVTFFKHGDSGHAFRVFAIAIGIAIGIGFYGAHKYLAEILTQRESYTFLCESSINRRKAA
jgi:hypothetical protein